MAATVRLLLVLVLSVLTILLAGCGPAASKYPYASEPDPRGREYVIGVGDGLVVRVWGHDNLGMDATVRPDGTITMPLVGDIAAAGRTPTQVKRAVARALTAFIKDQGATVTVAVTRSSYRVVVSGSVERPSVLEAQRYLTVSEAMVLAGGPNRFASADETVIIRSDPDGGVRHIPIQYDEVEAGRRPEQDLVLLNGDRIYVP